ncbi:tail fiber domain-containing protein [Escherichia coli]|uniref:tail fiber domain-containing protein n=1 Tax=Escherichia coli TaxID=562 RepID=UPI0022540041|nr:tail fiber domain-containing protein [Escherichia coli]MCX3185182.1 tail fiber domain-containing protein [Escherichia coli]
MLYNTGTIAINGNSATGTGTNWTAPASQVRAGQTIIVMSNPVQLFQISSVNSATSMTVTPAASPALSGQKYAILVSDNISVDGLAQAMSQLIKDYDENIGAWEAFATTSANQSITVTINGSSVTMPSIGRLAQKNSSGAVPLSQGGTGIAAKNADELFSGLGIAGTDKSNTFSSENIFTSNGACLTLRNALSNTSYIRFRDATNNVDLAFLGRGSANSDVVSLYGLKGNNAFDLRGDGTNYIRGATTFNAQIMADGGMVARGGGATIKTQGSQAAGSYIRFEDASGNQYGFVGNPSNTPGALSFYNFSNNNSFELRQDGTNFVRGNTTFNGSVTCVSLTQTSDRDLKEMIEPIEDPLEKISLLTGVTFRWKDNEYPSAGVIAQDVMNVLPEVIACAEDDDGNRHLAVEYSGLVGLCIEAIKAQQKQIESLKALIGGNTSGITDGKGV